MTQNRRTSKDRVEILKQVQDDRVCGHISSHRHPELVSGSMQIAHGIAAKANQLISKKTLFVTDEKIWQNCEAFFPENFLKTVAKKLILKSPKPDEKNLKKIAAAVKNCDLILALGGGTINDLCKFTSAKTNIPYAIFASAASMNGYLSKNASITISGHKKTLPATLPITVFCDLKILAKAPLELTKAGIGDSLCFYSCWFDWYLSHKILGTKFDARPFEMLQQKMDFFVKNFQKFSIRDEEFLKLLIEILLLSGQGMTLAGGSYPASQAEHLIAHTIEMKYPEIAGKVLHGAQIAVTTLTATGLQKQLLEAPSFPSSITTLSSSTPRVKGDELVKFFGKKIASECQKEFEQKIFAQSQAKKLNWPNLKKDLKKIHFDEARLKEIFAHFKIKTSARSLGLSNQQYQACVAHAKFIRNRFTILDFLN